MVDEQNPRGLVGRELLDVDGRTVGTIDTAWVDETTGAVQFFGVKSGGLLGKTYAVPAENVRMDDAGRLRVPYTEDAIKASPSIDVARDLTHADEAVILAHFEVERPRSEGTRTEVARIPLREEEIHVGKREVEDEVIRLRKVVKTEVKHVPVELRREEIHVERVPASEAANRPGEDLFEDSDEVVLRASHEEPVIEKTERVTGEVRAFKTEDVERRTVEGEVRREDVEIDRDGR